MPYEDIAQDVISICRDAIGIADWLAPQVAELYARSCSDARFEAAQYNLKQLIAQEPPFERIMSICQSICNGYTGWSAEFSDGLRAPEHFAEMLEYNDYIFYIEHLARDLDELSADGTEEVRGAIGDVLECKRAILEAIEPVLGRYGNY